MKSFSKTLLFLATMITTSIASAADKMYTFSVYAKPVAISTLSGTLKDTETIATLTLALNAGAGGEIDIVEPFDLDRVTGSGWIRDRVVSKDGRFTISIDINQTENGKPMGAMSDADKKMLDMINSAHLDRYMAIRFLCKYAPKVTSFESYESGAKKSLVGLTRRNRCTPIEVKSMQGDYNFMQLYNKH